MSFSVVIRSWFRAMVVMQWVICLCDIAVVVVVVDDVGVLPCFRDCWILCREEKDGKK
jgi:hypothetical protein